MPEITKFQEAARKNQQKQEENIQKLMQEQKTQEEWAKEVIAWQNRYNEVAKVNNRHVEILNQMMYFMSMQCGILYTAITGETEVKDPLKEISKIENASWDAAQEDLNYFRTGLIIYIKRLYQDGNVEAAMQDWQKYIAGQED